MLTKRDVENVFDQVESKPWEYWRDSGNYHCWFLDDGDWLLQVSHTQNVVAINDQRSDDGYTMATARYSDDRLGIVFVAAAAQDPEAAYSYLSDQPESSVVEAEIKWGGNRSGA